MKKEFNPKHLNLQLFAEGTDGGDGGTGAEGTMGETAAAAMSQSGVKRGKSNPLADVKYGIQEGTTSNAQGPDVQSNDANSIPDLNAEFEELIKGKFKDQYNSRMQDTIQKRLKSTRDTVEKYEALAPTLEMLAKKYGVDSTDITALNKAIEEDDSYYEEEAFEKGITVEQLKEIRKMEKENAELKKRMQEQSHRENGRKLMASWMNQAEQLKAVYPSFNLEAEMQNPKFLDLLKVPSVDVRTAYEVVHKDEIIPAAMQFTAKTVEQKLTNKIMANGARPIENGNSSQSASLTKSDVSQLSNADIDEINRRVKRGERISFGFTKR